MEIINTSPFQFANIVGRIGFPKHSLTLIVKGTFDLLPETKAVFSEEQLYPTGDEPYDEEGASEESCRYSSDFAYFKPRADLLLVGKCHAAVGQTTSKSRITFNVGTHSRSLAVFGNRYWKSGLSSFTDPEPFTEMAVRYENSFGGMEYSKNPIGKGVLPVQDADGNTVYALPNIENIGGLISSFSHRPEPAGFGSLYSMWQDRYAKLGSYGDDWLKQRWPWFPTDFDWGYFNAAPSEMQAKDYLIGDETLFFENLHAEHPHYHSQLPDVKVRLFLNELQSQANSTCFKEVPMKLDTLWVDMQAEKLVLVWRGITPVQSEDFEEIQQCFIATENLQDSAQTIDYYHQLLLKHLAEEEADEAYQINPLEIEEEDTTEIDKEIAEAEAQMRASLIEAGIDPDNIPEPTPEQKAEEAKMLKELGFEEEPEEQALTRDIIQRRIEQGEAFINEDLSDLDLSELNMQGVNFQSALLSGVSFKKSNLSNANFAQANLSNADLSNADLRGINLQDADLTGANLIGADLTGAILKDAIFEKAKLNTALLHQVIAENTYFSEANLSHAQLTQGMFQGADFSKCVLHKANFQGANLFEANVAGAIGIKINMAETDLTELRAGDGCNFSYGCFRLAKGEESIWEGAKLTGADFSYSQMVAADFSLADLESANLSAANMKFSRFTKANLKDAKFIQMNLFQGSLEKANLSRTDFRGSNLYAVEFLDAIIDETRFEQSNLKMTKLSKG